MRKYSEVVSVMIKEPRDTAKNALVLAWGK